MRSSRLVSLLLLLQARGQMTGRELAAELEVSLRTVYRDVLQLGAAGVPVYGEKGAGGGYRLLDGYRTNLTGLTAEEASALLLTGASGAASQLGLGTLLATTRLKLLAAVPPALRDVATRAEARFFLDPSGWAHAPRLDQRHLQSIARGVWDDRRLAITYRPGDARMARRTVDPLGLVHKTGTWYLVAGHESCILVYRVDRLGGITVTDEAAHRPEGFDLESFWKAWELDYAERLPRFMADVRLGPAAQRYRDVLGGLAPRSVEVVENDTSGDGGAPDPAGRDGWVRQWLLFDDLEIAQAAMMALAPDVEVLGPPELREAVATTAAAMAARHSAERAARAGI